MMLAAATAFAVAGNAQAKPAPRTTITSAPAALTSATSASFTFTSSISGSTFTCSVDGAPATACVSPQSYSGLTPGSHVFTVDATANGISDSSAPTATWRIDTASPSAPSGLTGTPGSPTSVGLAWTAGQDNTGVTNNRIMRDGSLLATVGAVTSYTDSTVAAASSHSYSVVALDGAGNASQPSTPVSVTTPLTPPTPDTVIDSGPAALANSTSATFAFHATLSGATFVCRLDGAKAATCTSPRSYTGLAQGTHSFSVVATVSGITDPTPATASWTVDTVAPSVPTQLAAAVDASGAVNLSWAASTDTNGVAGYDVFRDGSLMASVGAAATSYTDSGAAIGSTHKYAVRAKDTAGNVSALSPVVSIRVIASYDPHLTRAPYLTDLVGLHVAINYATDQSGTSASVQYGAVDGSGNCTPTTVVTPTRSTIAVGSVSEYQWTAQVTLPTTGTYCYRVYLGATDLLGANPSPRFTTQVPVGNTSGFSFDVLGDWGQVDPITGANTDQANLMTQIASSGARFLVTVGDNGYPNGSQINYGDLQQTGGSTSAIFGPSMWTVPGSSIPIFAAVGNHGVSGVKHTDITTWTQNTAVATSGGRYQNDVYCCVNGSTSSNYGSEWYAFDAGNVRFYMLDSAWGDLNSGTASPYANDALAHFTPGTPEYTWLLNDLQTHPSQLKFAFFHYPLYSDNNTQPSDTYLDGATNLEGLLGSHGVQLVFNGHAHTYERNNASASGMPISYVTGGGGATLEPMGSCSAFDAYGIGWGSSGGSTCGSARTPASAANVFHYLKVTVTGTSVTVTPTDSLGNTFDVRTYTFKVAPDTYLDTTPPVGTTGNTATFAFHASGSPATFTCKLDGGTAASCTSPKSYTGLAEGRHTFSVTATVNRQVDPTPAIYTWTVDHTAPNPPSAPSVSSPSPFEVDLSWSGASDNTGVTGYHIYRDGLLYETVGATTSLSDEVLGGSTHTYAVSALDAAGNESARSAAVPITTASPPVPVFQDGFESGDVSAWSVSAGLTVQGTTVNSGQQAAEGNTTNGNTFAKKTLPSTYPNAYARVAFDAVAQSSQINLLRLRDSSGNSIGYVYLDVSGFLGFHDDALGTNTVSQLIPDPGWHALELRIAADSTPGTATGAVQVWLDNALVPDLSDTTIDVGAAPVGSIQIGEVQAGRAYDVVFDDAAFGTSRLGPRADSTPPGVPTGLAATANSPFEVDLTWNAAADDTAGYDIFRDGTLLDTVGLTNSYADTSVLAGSTHSYAVAAVDAAGNTSAACTAVSITTPAAATPLFADGFENGDLSGWTSTSNLTVQTNQVRSGFYAAEATTSAGGTWAKKTLPGTYTDAYARVAFEVNSQSAQATLLRLRDTPTGNGGYLFLTAAGKLGFRSDALAAGTTSSVAPGPGWHALELHLVINGAGGAVQTWLDGALVPALSFATIDLGTAPMGVLQIGDTTSTGSWDIVFDDAAFGTSRLGPVGDVAAPSIPQNLAATASSPFSVDLSWDAATDDNAVAGYDLYRDGALLAGGLTGTGYTDTSVLAGTSYSYAVLARDSSNNVSALSTPANVTTPTAATPLFADGFESGGLSNWTSSSGLVVQSGQVRSGAQAADGSTTAGATWAKKTLPGTYTDAYARVAFEVNSQSAQATLLRMRDPGALSIGYVYLDTSGRLALHLDGPNTNTVSTLVPNAGWHVVELHMTVSTGLVQVWLDGAQVPSLNKSGSALGSNPIGAFQIGETTTGRTYDVVLDDAAFSASRIGTS
jgi:fibronectin type 3 domain-containing protein